MASRKQKWIHMGNLTSIDNDKYPLNMLSPDPDATSELYGIVASRQRSFSMWILQMLEFLHLPNTRIRQALLAQICLNQSADSFFVWSSFPQSIMRFMVPIKVIKFLIFRLEVISSVAYSDDISSWLLGFTDQIPKTALWIMMDIDAIDISDVYIYIGERGEKKYIYIYLDR